MMCVPAIRYIHAWAWDAATIGANIKAISY